MSLGSSSKHAKPKPSRHAAASAYDAAAQRLRDAARVLVNTLRQKAGFNPNQPRVPGGKPEGGQWTDGGVANAPSRTGQSIQTAEPTEWATISTSRRSDGTVCLYDIKTGRSGLGPARAVEIAAEVFDAFGTPQRIVVTEIRPQQ